MDRATRLRVKRASSTHMNMSPEQKNSVEIVKAWNKLEIALNSQRELENSLYNIDCSSFIESKKNKTVMSSQDRFIERLHVSQSYYRPITALNLSQDLSLLNSSVISQKASSRMTKNPRENNFITNPNSAIYYPKSSIASVKSIYGVRAKSRGSQKDETQNSNISLTQKQILSNFQESDIGEIMKNTEHVNSIPLDLILDLFSAQCQDINIDYVANQAVQFIEKIRQDSKHRKLNLSYLQLGKNSAFFIANLIKSNEQFYSYNLSQNSLGNYGALVIGEALRRNFCIVHLDISNNNFSSEGLSKLFECLLQSISLVSLVIGNKENFNKNILGTKGSESLCRLINKLPTMQILNVNNTALTCQQLEIILTGFVNKTTNIFEIDFANNPCGEGLTEEIMFKTQLTQLSILDLTNTQLGDKGLDAFDFLGTFRSKSFQLQQINLSDNGLTPYGIVPFLEIMQQNATIKKLVLDKNNLDSKEMKIISRFLTENQYIEILSMNNCNLQKDFGVSFGLGLLRNLGLREIYLKGNPLKDQGLKTIMEALMYHRFIEVLDLSQCSLGDETGVMIAEFIQVNKSIRKLALKENNFHDKTAKMVRESLFQNRNFSQISLERNNIALRLLEEIDDMILENTRKLKIEEIPNFQQQAAELSFVERLQDQVKRTAIELNNKEQDILEDITQTKDKWVYQRDEQLQLTQTIEDQYAVVKNTSNNIEEQRRDNEMQKDIEIRKLDKQIEALDDEFKLTMNLVQQFQVELRTKREAHAQLMREANQKVKNKEYELAHQTQIAKEAETAYQAEYEQIERMKIQFEAHQQSSQSNFDIKSNAGEISIPSASTRQKSAVQKQALSSPIQLNPNFKNQTETQKNTSNSKTNQPK